jgi:subtilase family serine protease
VQTAWSGPWTISTQNLLSLAASTDLTIKTAVNLPSGNHILLFYIDQSNAVAETNQNNNYFFVRYQLTGNCKDPFPYTTF